MPPLVVIEFGLTDLPKCLQSNELMYSPQSQCTLGLARVPNNMRKSTLGLESVTQSRSINSSLFNDSQPWGVGALYSYAVFVSTKAIQASSSFCKYPYLASPLRQIKYFWPNCSEGSKIMSGAKSRQLLMKSANAKNSES